MWRIRPEIYGDGGAYASLSNHVMLRATTHAAGPNEVPNVRVDTYAMYTNNVPCGAFRGFGVTQSGFAMECQMNVLAEALGIPPLEMRRKNILAVGKQTLQATHSRRGCGLPDCLEKVAAEMEQHPFVAVEATSAVRGAWRVPTRTPALAAAHTTRCGCGSGVYANGRAAVRAGAAEIGRDLWVCWRKL
ncbi:nicotinate dehydrogenase large molybdopterin subunit [Anaerolineaceae bacterium]|nr:nicotinate dehydrogenase large molybdopterin subunit [Anaerolineaceae bacterium]